MYSVRLYFLPSRCWCRNGQSDPPDGAIALPEEKRRKKSLPSFLQWVRDFQGRQCGSTTPVIYICSTLYIVVVYYVLLRSLLFSSLFRKVYMEYTYTSYDVLWIYVHTSTHL